MLRIDGIPYNTIRANGSIWAFPPPAAVAAALQKTGASALMESGRPEALREALARLEGVEPERIHTACCAFGILMRSRTRDQRRQLRPDMPEEGAIALRDFSRFGLLGINACYCIADPEMVKRLDGLGIPQPDGLASAAAAAAVRDRDCAQKLVAAVEKLREEAKERLRAAGYPAKAGEGAWVDIPCRAPKRLAQALLAHGVEIAVEEGAARIWMCPPEDLERLYFIMERERTLKKLSALERVSS